MAAPAQNGTNNPQTVTGGDAGSVIIGPTTIRNDSVFEGNINLLGTLTVAELQTDYDSLNVSGNITTNSNLTVIGQTLLSEAVTTQANVQVGTDLRVLGNVRTDGNITAFGWIHTTDSIQASGNIDAGGDSNAFNVWAVVDVNAGGNVNVTDTLNTNKVITTGNVNVGDALIASGSIRGSNFSGNTSGTNTGDQTITLTSDVTGSGTGTATNITTTLSSTGVTAGTYGSTITWPTFVVDAKGRISSASNITPGNVTLTGNLVAGNVSSTLYTGNIKAQDITANPNLTIATSTVSNVTIGNATGRLGFYGVTPVARAAAITAVTNTATGTELATAINALRVALQNAGITS